ncbi:hypothetical protein ACQKPE_15340 [Pseudomonas sp. NPDC089554]|uniref:hypothetical protein n=1 Tax=Pseudomonas sp. NPDC089554 TaxID=3390653 RepID=UPI003D0186AA
MKHNRLSLLLSSILMGSASYAAASTPHATAESLFGAELGDTRLVTSHAINEASGYRIESGNLVDPKGSLAGAVVWVTAPGGEVTALIDREGNRGVLRIDAQGNHSFSQDRELAYPTADAIKVAEHIEQGSGKIVSDMSYVDALVGFTAEALAAGNVDPQAFALAQMEGVNLSLRNSGVKNVELRLVGIRITDEKIPNDNDGLFTWHNSLLVLRTDYLHDINVGFSTGSNTGGYALWGGSSSVNSIESVTALRHSLGHNAGGSHCHPDDGDNYKHGYDAGDGVSSILCGNKLPYYSSPDVTVNDKVIGDAKTADMARLWREQAGRLSGYSPAFEGYRMILVSTKGPASLDVDVFPNGANGGVVALDSSVGPTALSSEAGSFTRLNVKLTSDSGEQQVVKVRASRKLGSCGLTVMNSNKGCYDAYGSFSLMLQYDAADNPELAPGWYNGALRLQPIDANVSTPLPPILVSLSIQH